MKRILIFKIIFLAFIIGNTKMYAQNDNISTLSYKDIEKKIVNVQNDSTKLWKFINFYINKSKKEKNNSTLLYAYRFASNYSSFPTNLKYADSTLIIANKSKSKDLLIDAYLSRCNIFMYEEKYQKALDDVLIANKYADELRDEYIINKTIYFIAQNKIYLGLYNEANDDLKSSIMYFKKHSYVDIVGRDYQLYYIYCLMSYIDSNTKLGKQQENKLLLKEVFNYIDKNDNLKIYKPYFISSEGTDFYYTKDYNNAIKKLSEALQLYNDQWTHITEKYYIGLSYWKLNNKDKAIEYFEKIDKEYNQTKKLDPQFRPAYELLIKYNDSIGNKDKQLEYINKLMILDKSYEKNYQYLYTKINKEYDTKKLIDEKNKIERSLKIQGTAISFILLVALGLLSFLVYRNYKIHKNYKAKFEELISQKEKTKETIEKEKEESKNISSAASKSNYDIEYYNKIEGLNPIFVENILNQLKIFERDNKFLDIQVSQKLLSENLETNSTYFSKIINVYKGKSFNHYINDLRLDYILEILKNDPKYLNYDVKDLALMCGFTNAISFSDNFQRKFKIKPSYFIKMMKENIRTSAQ